MGSLLRVTMRSEGLQWSTPDKGCQGAMRQRSTATLFLAPRLENSKKDLNSLSGIKMGIQITPGIGGKAVL